MDEQPTAPVPVPEAPPEVAESPPEPVPEPVPLPAHTPTGSTWTVRYTGTTPLTKGGFTWQPGQSHVLPEALAKTLVGSDNLRVVQDERFIRQRGSP